MAENNKLPALRSSRLPWHPIMEEYGVQRTDWQALVEAVFPAAQSLDSIRLALSYCKRRNLDPFKRVIHIVPVWDSEQRKLVDTIWPGIAELRTTAFRTQQYAGADPTEFGPTVEGAWQDGSTAVKLTYPAWAQLTVYRLVGGQRVPVPGPRVYWMETYSAKGRSDVPNERWRRAPFQMLEKCSEAAALRRAFPEELGDEHSHEELGAITRDVTPYEEPAPAMASPLRGNAALRSRLQTEPPPEPPPEEDESEEDDSPAPDSPAQTPAAADVSVAATPAAVGVTPPAATSRRRRGKLEEPTEDAIARSQEALAAVLGPESVDWETARSYDEHGELEGDISVLVPFDAASNVQEWFGRARTRLREMQEARLTPDRFTAYQKANAGALMRLKSEFYSYWETLNAIIAAGERGGAALGYVRPDS